jgi:uncharacterized small protein (DUF1192 family)|tara:strand:+ start:304 stop:483 length:180 start_codon:yes stop_codon:yes gene_type:complete
MEEDEDIKKKVENEKNYDEFSIEDLLDEIYNLKKQLKYLENLLKNKKSGHKQADKLFKK